MLTVPTTNKTRQTSEKYENNTNFNKKSTKTLTPIIHINIRKKINYQNEPQPHQSAKTNKTPDKIAQFHKKHP